MVLAFSVDWYESLAYIGSRGFRRIAVRRRRCRGVPFWGRAHWTAPCRTGGVPPNRPVQRVTLHAGCNMPHGSVPRVRQVPVRVPHGPSSARHDAPRVPCDAPLMPPMPPAAYPRCLPQGSPAQRCTRTQTHTHTHARTRTRTPVCGRQGRSSVRRRAAAAMSSQRSAVKATAARAARST